MALPIDPLTTEAVQALRAQGFTQEKIQEVLKLSRSTVHRCLNPRAKEQNADCARRRRNKALQSEAIQTSEPLF